MATMKLEKRDYPMILLGFFALAVSIFRFIRFSGPANDFMSGFIALIGLLLFLRVYRKVSEEGETIRPSIPPRSGFPYAPRPYLPPSPCPHCNNPLTFIPEYDRWYCYSCREYAPEG